MERKPVDTLDKLKAVPKYDPSKNYTWDAQDIFTVTGAEIDIWNKAMAVYVNTPEFQRYLVLQKAASVMQAFIQESVEQSLIKEKIEESPKPKEDGQAVEVNG